jgi:hypothetical protein
MDRPNRISQIRRKIDDTKTSSAPRVEIDLTEGCEPDSVDGEAVVLDWDDIEFIDDPAPSTSHPDAERVTARLRPGARIQRLDENADDGASQAPARKTVASGRK